MLPVQRQVKKMVPVQRQVKTMVAVPRQVTTMEPVQRAVHGQKEVIENVTINTPKEEIYTKMVPQICTRLVR